ncbi:probable serine protease EDA2 isoform X3 [Citrus clementina]|uniref:probable serine protease EDA2 isoform X3 n=1 Tax=Citrus clementina TaxID=85681 RepID=UPI000CECFA88|nr:probable serine protease EDA2 isoform X3 [Citrus x clementina]
MEALSVKPPSWSTVMLFVLSMLLSISNGLMPPVTMLNKLSGSTNYLTTNQLWFNQTLDHFSPYDHRWFEQRYYELLDHFRSPDGPIFLRICGEYTCDGIPNDYLAESLNLKLKRGDAENTWFVFGISYPGALSAWFRLKFPHLTCGSLASSAVVQAIYNFTEFDQQIGVSAGPECKAALQETTQLVEQRLASNAKAVKTMFDAAELEIEGDFLYFLADAAVTAFQYGNPDKLCTPLVEAKNAGEDLVDAYAKFVKEYYLGSFGASVQTYNQKRLKNTAVTDQSADRLWWFQVCTEVAFFQVAPANDSVRSSKVDTRYHLDLCKNVFGEGIYPDVDSTNIYYGGTKIAGSKIVFTNGSQDPWRHASKQTSSPDMPSYLITCHNCGHGTDLRGCPQSPLTPEGDAQNCSAPDAVHKVRQQVIEKIDLWLSECQSVGWRSSM